MKPLLLPFFIFLLSQSVVAQNFSLGIENGINFSNKHQSLGTAQTDGRPGPVNGIFARYEVLPWLVLQSGVNHASFYFDQKIYDYYYYDWYMLSSSFAPASSSLSIAPPSYYYRNENFSFLRVPLLVKLKTGGRLSAEFGGGIYYGILTNDEYRGKDSEIYTEEYINNNFPPLNDWGSIVAGSLNFQINNHWSVFAAAQVTNARTHFFKDEVGKIGSFEFTFGVGYAPFGAGFVQHEADSAPSRVVFTPHAGLVISAAHVSKDNEKYQNKNGFSGGVSVKIRVDNTVSLGSGVWFEGRGYGLKYFGNSGFIYLPPANNATENIPEISSEVNLSYLTFPFLTEVGVGNKFRSNFSAGFYYSWLQNASSQGERLETYQNGAGYRVTKVFFENDLDNWVSNNDVGFMFGYQIGFSVFKKADVFLGVNQSLGIVNVFDNLNEIQNPPRNVSNTKMYNRATTIMAGVNIPLAK